MDIHLGADSGMDCEVFPFAPSAATAAKITRIADNTNLLIMPVSCLLQAPAPLSFPSNEKIGSTVSLTAVDDEGGTAD